MILRKTNLTAVSDREREAERLLARRRSIIIWCDRHLIAIHMLSALMTDDPLVVKAALAELRSAPDAVNPSKRVHSSPLPAHTPAIRDQCPTTATAPIDRVELALMLIGNHSCTGVSQRLGIPERSVSARLNSGLAVLFAPCQGD